MGPTHRNLVKIRGGNSSKNLKERCLVHHKHSINIRCYWFSTLYLPRVRIPSQKSGMPETYKATWSKLLSFNRVSVNLDSVSPTTSSSCQGPENLDSVQVSRLFLMSTLSTLVSVISAWEVSGLTCYPRSCLAMIEGLSSKHPQDLLIFPLSSTQGSGELFLI